MEVTSLIVFPYGTTSKLAGLFSTLSPQCWASSRETVNSDFKVIGLTRIGIKPKSTAPALLSVGHLSCCIIFQMIRVESLLSRSITRLAIWTKWAFAKETLSTSTKSEIYVETFSHFKWLQRRKPVNRVTSWYAAFVQWRNSSAVTFRYKIAKSDATLNNKCWWGLIARNREMLSGFRKNYICVDEDHKGSLTSTGVNILPKQ